MNINYLLKGNINDIILEENKYDKIVNYCYSPITENIKSLEKYCKLKNFTKILEIGPGTKPFSLATHFIDNLEREGITNIYNIDIDNTVLPFPDKYFDFVYCRHVLEDIQNPDFAFKEIIRISRNGYIETPSPIVECTENIDNFNMPQYNGSYKGYVHHRYLIWSIDNKIYFLPKLPIIEHMTINNDLNNKIIQLLNKYPIYWNNYYMWNENTNPEYIIYKHDYNFDIRNNYDKIIYGSFDETIKNTNIYIPILYNFY